MRRFLTKHADIALLVFLVMTTAVSLGVGVYFYPESDVEPNLPGEFMIEVPASIRDASGGEAMLRDVSWYEYHASDGPVELPPMMLEHPLPSPDTVRVELSMSYAGNLTTDVPIEVVVDLPAAAKFLGCAPNTGGGYLDCAPSAPVRNALFGQDQIRVTVDTTVGATDAELGDSRITVIFDVSGVDGISFVSNRARLAVQMPTVAFLDPPPGADLRHILPVLVFEQPQDTVLHVPHGPDGGHTVPFLTRVESYLPGASSINWTEEPHITGANVPSLVGWVKQTPPNPVDPSFGAVPVTGVRNNVLREDAARIFRSGIALGIAGSAAVTLLQVTLSTLLKRLRGDRTCNCANRTGRDRSTSSASESKARRRRFQRPTSSSATRNPCKSVAS